MSASVDQNVTLSVGEDRTLTFTVLDSAGDAVDIGGATVAWKMRRHALASTNVLSKSGALVSDGSGGQFTVAIADTDTDALEPRVYYHEAKVTDSGGLETVVSLGYLHLRASVS